MAHVNPRETVQTGESHYHQCRNQQLHDDHTTNADGLHATNWPDGSCSERRPLRAPRVATSPAKHLWLCRGYARLDAQRSSWHVPVFVWASGCNTLSHGAICL